MFTVTDVYPGWTSGLSPSTFRVKNVGTIIGHLQFTSEGTSFVDQENGRGEAEISADTDDQGELCANLQAKVMEGNTVLADWQPVKTLQPTGNVQLNGGEEKTLSVAFKVPGAVGNVIQSDGCLMSLGLRLVQDTNQNGRADEDEKL